MRVNNEYLYVIHKQKHKILSLLDLRNNCGFVNRLCLVSILQHSTDTILLKMKTRNNYF